MCMINAFYKICFTLVKISKDFNVEHLVINAAIVIALEDTRTKSRPFSHGVRFFPL